MTTKGEIINWYLSLKSNSTEEETKNEAIRFFGDHIKSINKQTISWKLKALKAEHKNLKNKIKKKNFNGTDDPIDYIIWSNTIADFFGVRAVDVGCQSVKAVRKIKIIL